MRYIPGTEIGIAELEQEPDEIVQNIAIYLGIDTSPTPCKDECMEFIIDLANLD